MQQGEQIYLADPAMINNNGVYYLFGTVEGNTGNGFITYTSPDMQQWKKDATNQDGYALKKGTAYGSAGFWAPHIFSYRSKYYMAYTANEHIAIATSGRPSGPFVQSSMLPLEAPVKQIDPFVFIDEDGKKYLYHVRLTNGNRIFVAEMKDDLSAIITTTLKECITATEQWENTANAPWPVTEGPSVIKRNSLYYLFYSANDFRNSGYAVGYATSKSPYGPWKKYAGNPIISSKLLGVNGPGHGDFIQHTADSFSYVFHTHHSNTVVSPRKTALIPAVFVNDGAGNADKLLVDRKNFRFLTAQ